MYVPQVTRANGLQKDYSYILPSFGKLVDANNPDALKDLYRFALQQNHF